MASVAMLRFVTLALQARCVACQTDKGQSTQLDWLGKCYLFCINRLRCKLSLRWPNTVLARAFADAIQHVHKDFNKQNMPSIERSFCLLNNRTICVIFHYN